MKGPLRPQARHTLLVAVATALHLNQSPLTYSLPEAFIAAFSTILIRDCFNAGLLFTALDLAASIHALSHCRIVKGCIALNALDVEITSFSHPVTDLKIRKSPFYTARYVAVYPLMSHIGALPQAAFWHCQYCLCLYMPAKQSTKYELSPNKTGLANTDNW